jgi:Major Facilitator Superfamily
MGLGACVGPLLWLNPKAGDIGVKPHKKSGEVVAPTGRGDRNDRAGPDPLRWKALALLCAINFMVILDSEIVILGVPSIEQDLGFSADGVQWVLSVYLLSFGGLLLLGGRAGDLLGRRRVLIAGTVLFGVSSLACGLAWSPAALVAARLAQGVSAAIMAPTALAILMTTFSEGARAQQGARVLGWFGRARCHGCAAGRRHADRRAGLGVDFPDQLAGGRRAGRAQSAAAAREPRARRGAGL